MNRKQLVSGVLAKARKYRSFTRWISDGETAERISALSEKLQWRASVLAKPTKNRIRRRAREIWEENGRPPGRDEEFWFQAEREFREGVVEALLDSVADAMSIVEFAEDQMTRDRPSETVCRYEAVGNRSTGKGYSKVRKARVSRLGRS